MELPTRGQDGGFFSSKVKHERKRPLAVQHPDRKKAGKRVKVFQDPEIATNERAFAADASQVTEPVSQLKAVVVPDTK